jgi:5,10-methylenetetrahydromethanopterin reductase
VAVPFRISVVQLTMEPVEHLLRLARALDRAGFDALWLGEAYPWWRRHLMEARSSTSISALVARETERLAVGWGIVSPYTRHPIQIAMEARVLQEVAGPGRFLLGLGASKIFMKEAAGGRPEFGAEVPALADEAESPRGAVPLYIGGTGPRMLRLAGAAADGLITASITTPAFVRYARTLLAEGAGETGRDAGALDVGSVIVASIDEDSARGKEGAREIAGMYLANKVQNIQGAADVLIEKAGLSFEEIQPVADALLRGGRKACAEAVTDEIFRKVKPIAGTPAECIEAIEEYRDAGCTHIQLELWGECRERQAELFGRHVLPHFR